MFRFFYWVLLCSGLIISNYKLVSLIDYSDKDVFKNVSTYPVITFLKTKTSEEYKIRTGKFDDNSKMIVSNFVSSNKLNILNDNILGFLLNEKLSITEKIISVSESLNIVGKINATSTAKEADDYSPLFNDSIGLKIVNTGTIDPYLSLWGNSILTNKGQYYLKPLLKITKPLWTESPEVSIPD